MFQIVVDKYTRVYTGEEVTLATLLKKGDIFTDKNKLPWNLAISVIGLLFRT